MADKIPGIDPFEIETELAKHRFSTKQIGTKRHFLAQAKIRKFVTTEFYLNNKKNYQAHSLTNYDLIKLQEKIPLKCVKTHLDRHQRQNARVSQTWIARLLNWLKEFSPRNNKLQRELEKNGFRKAAHYSKRISTYRPASQRKSDELPKIEDLLPDLNNSINTAPMP